MSLRRVASAKHSREQLIVLFCLARLGFISHAFLQMEHSTGTLIPLRMLNCTAESMWIHAETLAAKGNSMTGGPRPVTTDQRYLARLCDLLDEQNTLLAGIRDGLTGRGATHDTVKQPGEAGGPVVLNLREPAPPAPEDTKTSTSRPARRPGTKKGSR